MTKDLRAAKNFTNRLDGHAPPTMDDYIEEWEEAADAGSSLTRPVKASALRINEFVMLRGNPCKIVSMLKSKPGKHGHAKIHLVGLDVATGKKYEDISPSTHTMAVPVSSRQEYIVVDMGRTGYISLLDDSGNMRSDIRVEDDAMRAKITERLDKQDNDDIMVTVLTVLDKELVMSVKTGVK